jgi:ABC-2 type transport system permease protein
MMRFIRSCFVIARRDFAATVLSKAFIFFLLGPLFPLLLGGVFGGIGASVATRAQRPAVGVLMPPEQFKRLNAARDDIADAVGEEALVKLYGYAPGPNVAEQEKQLLTTAAPPIRTVVSGDLANPHIVTASADDEAMLRQLRLILARAKSGETAPPPAVAVTQAAVSNASLSNDRANTALYGEMLIFFLTLFLAGMVMSQMIEEKSNKIIEVIAAAVPVDAMFVGKLFAMLAASVIGIIVWLAAGTLFIQMIKHGGVATLPVPAVGWPGFLALVVIYIAMNYLLIGAIMLTIGAQASTAREVQVLAMPATFGQLLVFAFATTAVGSPDSPRAIAAMIFPLSSPMAMLARAAQDPQWWPHLLAILWQALWVGLILRAAAQLFRKVVLKSGPRTRWWKRKSVA